jgi:ABC-type transport system involved in multi-copper enzyme maturation permease subunit
MLPKPISRFSLQWWLSQFGRLFVVVGAIALWKWSDPFPGWPKIAAWSVLGLVLVASLYPLWRTLLGPVLFYDMVRSTRRSRSVTMRCLYAVALLVILFLFYATKFGSLWSAWVEQSLPPNEAAQFAENFFEIFVSVQFVFVLLLTPAFTANAIAEEKDRRTLEFLFTTDLENHEIVLGKLVSRLAFMTLLLLTGLPVLSLLQFLGGVDPNMVLAAFAATGMTMLSLAGLSLFNSAYVRKPLTATILTYLQVAVYLVSSTIVATQTGLMSTPAASSGQLFSRMFCIGNMWVNVHMLGSSVTVPGSLSSGTGLLWLLAGYAVFHGLLTLLTLLGATLPLRRWARWQASGGNRRAFVLSLTQKRLPLVGNQPMIWKEVYAEPIFRFNRTGMIVTGTFVTICLILGSFIMIASAVWGLTVHELSDSMNRSARLVGTGVAYLLLLGVALRAAGCVGAERDRQTLDSLLTCPLENHDILWAKWLGSILSGRKLWWFLAAVWLSAAICTGLHPAAVVLLVVAWTVYAMFLASLGLWCSVNGRTTLRATIWTLVVTLLSSMAPWVLAIVWNMLRFLTNPMPGYRRSEPSWVGEALSLLAPPSALYYLSFREQDFFPADVPYWQRNFIYDLPESALSPWSRVLIIAFGLICYALAAAILWSMVQVRFPLVTGRMPRLVGNRPRKAPREQPTVVVPIGTPVPETAGGG